MKHFLTLFMVMAITVLVAQNIPPRPYTNNYVYDYADVLTDSEEESLRAVARAIETESTAQVVVYTTNDMPDNYPIEEYTLKIAEKWGIGQRGADNGLLIFISPETHDSRIEVGYGLEGDLTDAYTYELQQSRFNPNFRNGDFYQGLFEAMNEIKSRISPQAKEQRRQATVQRDKEAQESTAATMTFLIGFVTIGGVLLIIGITIYYFYSKAQREKQEKEDKERAARDAKELYEITMRQAINSLQVMGNFYNAPAIIETLQSLKSQVDDRFLIAKQDDYGSISQSAIAQIDGFIKEINTDYQNKMYVQDACNKFIQNGDKNLSDIKATAATAKQLLDQYSSIIWSDTTPIRSFIENVHTINKTFSELHDEFSDTLRIVQTTKNRSDYATQLNRLRVLQDGLSYYFKMSKVIDQKSAEIADVKSKLKNHNASDTIGVKIQAVKKYFTTNAADIANSLEREWKAYLLDNDFVFSTTSKDPIGELAKINEWLKEIERFHTRAKNDVEREERARRDRYNSTLSSTTRTTSYGSSGGSIRSSGGGSTFGGGRFGGGGSSSKW